MIRDFAGHPTAANLLMILIAAAGLLALPGLVRETFPDYQPKEIAITVEYRGAAPADVEEAICERIDAAVLGVTDLAELRCVARQGVAQAEAEMAEGGDFPRFLDNVTTEVGAIDDFPDAAEDPVITEMHQTDAVASVAVTGPMSVPDLKAYAEDLQARLLRLPLIADVTLQGFSDRQYRIAVPKATLRQYGVSAADIAGTVAAQTVNRPAGVIETEARDLLLRFDDERQSVAALADLIVVSGETGAELRLGEIATITDTFEADEERIDFDGRRAAVLEIAKSRDDDSLDAMAALERFLAAERARMPEDVRLEITQDQTSIVADRLGMLVDNALQGMVLVLLVLCLFFSLRFSFWVAAGLPVAFLGGFFVLWLAGLSINMISLVGFLMAIGILMDDAIVIAENIAAHAAEKDSTLEAVVAGVRQVGPGIASSFITTVSVFGPLAFLSGEIGRVLQVMPIVLLVVLAVSLIEAFLILPHHLLHPVARMVSRPPGRFRARFDRGFDWVRENLLGRAVDAAVKARYAVLGALLFVFLGTSGFVAGGNIGFEALPELDGDVLEARILMPQGTPLQRTEAVVARATNALEQVNRELTPQQPGGRALVQSVQVRYARNASANEQGAHVATVVADLLSAERRTVTIDDLAARWRAAIGSVPGMLSLVLTEPAPGPAGLPIAIRVSGADMAALDAVSARMQDWLAGFAGVRDILDDTRPGKPELRFRLREGAHALGLTAEEIASQLSAAFLGAVAAEIQVGDESFEIAVRHADRDRDGLEDIEDFSVSLPDGTQVPLQTVAAMTTDRGWARIQHVDGRRTVTVQADVDPKVTNAIALVARMRAELFPELRAQYPEVAFDVEGQADSAAETGASIRSGFLIGMIGVFVVLAFQFRSYVEPVLVMLAIPFAMLGALWGHVIMGYDLSMPSLVGAVSLAGIVVNNSILLVNFIESRRADGRSLIDAAAQASRDRFRAIVMSTSTTIAGLVPLLFETSLQAQVLKPLVISVGFGLLTATVLVLVALPSLYAILQDLRGLLESGRARRA